MQIRTVKLNNQLDSQLLQLVKKTGKKQSDIIREALTLYLLQQQPEQSSIYEQTKKFCGIIKGPANLSTHKKHLKGFGE